MAYVPGSYQAGLVAKGYRDNGDGSFTSPDGQIIIPQMADAQTAAINGIAGQALQQVQRGYGADDPNFDPRYAMLSAERHVDPHGFDQYFGMPHGTELDAAGNIKSKPPSWLSTYGPWLALAGVGGVIAAPAIAGALSAGAGAADLSAPIAGSIGTGVPAGVGTVVPLAGVGGTAAGAGTLGAMTVGAGVPAGIGTTVPLVPPVASGGGSALGGIGSYLAKNPMVTAGAINTGGNLLGGVIQSHAASKAADAQAQAIEEAAQIQAKSAADALAFEKSQAALSTAQQAAAQYGNYQQWAAQQQRLGTLGQLLGLGPRSVPAYTPLPTSVAPNGTFVYGSPAPAGSGQTPVANGLGMLLRRPQVLQAGG